MKIRWSILALATRDAIIGYVAVMLIILICCSLFGCGSNRQYVSRKKGKISCPAFGAKKTVVNGRTYYFK